jgi:glucose-6-phosphate isomerase
MVGHYWLRDSKLAPSAKLRADIDDTNSRIKQFAADVHAGKIAPQNGELSAFFNVWVYDGIMVLDALDLMYDIPSRGVARRDT